jgi:glycosyltransferase involved in cell wall biosynthesis
MKTISLIVPFFNEQEVVSHFFNEIRKVTNSVPPEFGQLKFEFLCIDDGSKDATLQKLIKESNNDPRITIIEFSRNFGKEAALTAGIDSALGDAVIPIDSDLQDPPQLIIEMIEWWIKGFQVVLAKRENRKSDSFFKRLTAEIFYRVHNYTSGIKIPRNVGDFRLMDRSVIETLKLYPENQRFMKGIFSSVGFKTHSIGYVRQKRAEGISKFNGLRLINFAIEGITSFSTMPLRLFSYVGIVGTTLTSIYASIIFYKAVINDIPVPGYASLALSILFLVNVQILGIGILGEYIGRIYMESKRRPIYIIKQRYPANKLLNGNG